MRTRVRFVSLLFVCLLPVIAARVWAPQDSLTALQRAFERPPDDSRILMRWWWFGPSATKPELEREMRLMKESGIGGFEVQPVYPLALDDPERGFRNYPFLSDDFIDALRFTNDKARELGLRVDVTLGSGWPFGGPSVPVTQAASRLRIETRPVPAGARWVPLPHVEAGEKLLASFLAPGEPKNFAAGRARELSEIRAGAAWLPEGLEGPQVVLFFLASRTGMQVKRPAVGAEGFVVDHYDRRATESYLKAVGDPLMRAFGSNPPYAVFCDSLEVYNSDWAPDFLEEFHRRRGYDLKPYLPALAGDIGEKTGAIRQDWGRTLTELLDERFLGSVTEWAHRNRTWHRAQVYGIPPASLASNQRVDLAEGEGGPNWRRFSRVRWASSANHLLGRSITSSETWTWLHSPAFRATPLDLKAEADLHFLAGVNQLIGHGWPYSPEVAGEPGWRFYAAGAFNEHNPWWLVMPDVSLYLQRVSYLLRQGNPVNDVALYLPTEDAYARFAPGRASVDEAMPGLIGPNVIPQILDSGYGFDFVDATMIETLARVEDRALAIGANRYKIVILPGVERIPLAVLRRLDEFARHGGSLLATRQVPSLAPGLREQETQTPAVRELSRALFEGQAAPAKFLAAEETLGRELALRIAPDVSLSPARPEIGFLHRRTPFAEIYFIANTGNQRTGTLASFRVTGMQPEWWDPMTGRVSSAVVQRVSKDTTTVALDLEPYESRVLVFSRRAPSPPLAVPSPRCGPGEVDLSAGWNVRFADRSGRTVRMERLRSWTDDDETRYFSGLATYEKSLALPAEFLQPGWEVALDFGPGTPLPSVERRSGMQAWLESPVREAAVVYLNEQRVGSVWHAPFSLDVTPFLRPGENRFRVIVGNLAINALAGTTLPDYRLLNQRYGERFQPQNMENLQPLPSGLLGRIRLHTREARPIIPAK